MNYGLGLGHGLVDLQMQRDFAGLRVVANDLVVLKVNQHQVLSPQVAFAQHCGSADHILRRDSRGDVAAVPIHILPLPQLSASRNNLFLQSLGSPGME